MADSLNIPNEQCKYSSDRIARHETAAYQNFSYFVTISSALLGGISYLSIQKPVVAWWKIQTVAWSAWKLECAVAAFFTITIWIHYRRLRHHWKEMSRLGVIRPLQRWRFIGNVEPWFILFMWVVVSCSYFMVLRPLFGYGSAPP
jgi:hypothetical protein